MKLFQNILLILTLISAGYQTTTSQPDFSSMGRGNRFSSSIPNEIRYDVLSLPSSDTMKSTMVILTSIPDEFFISQRTPGEGFQFHAEYEMSIEITDSVRNSIVRKIYHYNVNRLSEPINTEADSTSVEQNYIGDQRTQSLFCFQLLPGIYKVFIEITDLHSSRKFRQTIQENLKDFRKPFIFSDILFLEPPTKSNFFSLLSEGGDVKLDQQFALGCLENISIDSSLNISHQLRQAIPESERSITLYSDSNSTPRILKNILFVTTDTSISITTSDKPTPISMLLLPLKNTPLLEGRYTYEFRLDRRLFPSMIRKMFFVRWDDMPRSLHNFSYAASMLDYLMTKNQFDSLNSLPQSEKFQEFQKFWESKDPSPGTALNEALEAYYHRIDEAQTKYSSLSISNGARSDRGRISILYGPPDTVERILPPGKSPIEIWKYPGLKKEFLFEDPSRNGTYILSRINVY